MQVKSLLSVFLGTFTTINTIFLWLILFFGFNHSFLKASSISLITAFVFFFGIKWTRDYLYLKKQRLTRKEYMYIQKNLIIAKKKINRLQKAFFSARTIGSFRQLYELVRLVKKMYAIVKKEPKRFFQSERFFFSHLDSIVELSERYATLASQPIKDDTVYVSLKDAQNTLEDLTDLVRKDIQLAHTTDIEDLNFELLVAKHSLNKLEYQTFDDERGNKDE